MSQVTPFRLTDDLPTGITVLEASAGTGKTYAIAGLVTRYVAEGMRLPQLLVVTFTRAATAELRDRVRRRLVAVAAHLEAVLAGGNPDSEDEVAAHLAQGDPATLRQRLEHLNRALTEFDAATIATIHGFCQHVLHGVGLASDVERDAEFLEDQAELVDTVVDDVYVRTFRGLGEIEGAPTRDQLRQIADAVVNNPDAEIVPEGAEDRWVSLRVRLAHEIRAEVERRKRSSRLLSYDNLLTRLRDTLLDPLRGPAARRRLREQYRVALVDEFQDTDTVQWRILAETFGGDDPATLVLIGDPKQAIYSFRGADVYAYLEAAGSAVTRRTLVTNWRSDGNLLDAYNVLFDGAAFGDDRIPYREVAPPDHHRNTRLIGGEGAPLQIRVLTREAEGVRFYGRNQYAVADSAREHLARDLAAEIVTLLRAAPTLVERRPDGSERKDPLHPGDIAVLARTNDEAARVQRALHDVGVPAIINGVGSVFETPAATAWQRLLEAIERPSAPARVRVAALTPFVGWSAEQLAAADEDEIDALRARLHRWADVLRDHSVASLLRTIVWEQRLPERLLGVIGGERLLTDLEHVGELLHAAATAEELGPTALAGWLREQMAEAVGERVPPEERARRLESDAEAVQVLTIHRSKGLEFPVVYSPFLWSGGGGWIDVPLYHPDGKAQRVADVGGKASPDFKDAVDLATREQLGEAMRLLYVALTRARHRAVVWWAPVTGSQRSPLGRVLFCRGRDGRVLALNSQANIPKDDEAFSRLEALAQRGGGTISVAPTRTTRSVERWEGRPREPATFEISPFERGIDRSWYRTSYSRLTAPAHEPRIRSESADAVKDDENLPAEASGDGAEPGEDGDLRSVPLPLGDLPAGTAFGTFVHAVLEETDFADPDLDAELAQQVDEQLGRFPIEGVDREALVGGLRRVLATPLGPLAGETSLAGVPKGARLDELGFELPLAGGASPTGEVTLAAIGRLLNAHLDPDDPVAAYAERLAEPYLQHAARGYLTGSIDLVLRVGGDGDPRFLVIDHKTNRLAPPDEELTAWHYRRAALTEAMSAGHYPLQALLYTVALHRFLRWRLRDPAYDPDRHLGGVLYLFLRGMTGADVPRSEEHPCGVFSWRPPTELVVAVSDLLDRGESK